VTVLNTGNSSIDTSLICDIYCDPDPEVLFETCVTMKFVDDDNDDCNCNYYPISQVSIMSLGLITSRHTGPMSYKPIHGCSLAKFSCL